MRNVVWALLCALLAVVGVIAAGAWWITGPYPGAPPAIERVAGISAERMRSDVNKLCNGFGPRDCRNSDNLKRVAEWIAGQMRQAGLHVEYDEYETSHGRYGNVIGRRRGSDPAAAAILVGAHYDTVRRSPGANDNASGVAVLLELVRTLSPDPPSRPQMFVAFSTEEPPCGSERMGSEELAWRLERDGVEIDLMLSLDMVGYFTDEPGSQHSPIADLGLLYPRHGSFLGVFGDRGSRSAIGRVKLGLRAGSDLPVRSFSGPSGLQGSDHLPFRELGFPAVLVTDTGPLRYDHWHGSGDVPEMLDYDRMVEVVRGVHGVLALEHSR